MICRGLSDSPRGTRRFIFCWNFLPHRCHLISKLSHPLVHRLPDLNSFDHTFQILENRPSYGQHLILRDPCFPRFMAMVLITPEIYEPVLYLATNRIQFENDTYSEYRTRNLESDE